MTHRHLTEDQLIAHGTGALPPEIAGCDTCRALHRCVMETLGEVTTTATMSADAAFPPARLARQRARILTRIERYGQQARILAFPSPRAQRPALLHPRLVRRWVAAAAAAGLVVGGGGAWWVANHDDTPTVLATATLEPLPGWDASGSAMVETGADGSRVLVVDLSHDAPSGEGFREVWLLKPDVSGLVSLGTLEGTSGRFDLPAGLDLSQYSVVDVSEEQFDGNPAHSGDSIVRGPLEA